MADETLNKIKQLINGDSSNITQSGNVARTGLNMDQSLNQVQQGQLTYALNAAVENFDSNSVNYQNEPGNEICCEFPMNYKVIGTHFINEQNKHIFFLTDPDTGASEIGYMENNDCIYRTYINGNCLNFNVKYPINKAVHKITNCTTELYWTDGFNPRRYLDLNPENIPYKIAPNTSVCDNRTIPELDCNKIKVQPNFSIPEIKVVGVENGGNLTAGTYQFAVQYCDVSGDGYTSYYSVTNPTPIANTQITTLEFNYNVGKSIRLSLNNLDVTGYFKYYNLAVIKTVNAITSVELVGTYFIDESSRNITYSGQNQTQIRLTLNDIFEKFPYYEIAQDLTAVQDILVWDNLTSIDRINYQQIANQITLNWQTYRLAPGTNYSDEVVATNLRGYLRDEVYPFEIVFLLDNGKQTDGFHIPGRAINFNESFPDVPTTNPDFVGTPTYYNGTTGYSPYWKIYNTASVLGNASGDPIAGATPYKYGEFAYWESESETYPCNELVWGELANKPIRHHKFPDVLVSPIFENSPLTNKPDGTFDPKMVNEAIFPIGVLVDPSLIRNLIATSNLTTDQKDSIVGFKIVRGDRSTNQSIVAKGILRNVGKYTRQDTQYYFPNYPYNDLREDPFLLDKSNAYTIGYDDSSEDEKLNNTCRSITATAYEDDTVIEYLNCDGNLYATIKLNDGESETFCALGTPIVTSGKACLISNTYKLYKITTGATVGITTFKMIDPSGYGCNTVGITPPAPYTTFCDFCNANPTDGCCTGSTIVAGKFTEVNNSTTGLQFAVRYIRSIIKPVYVSGNTDYTIEVDSSAGYDTICTPKNLKAYDTDDSKYRQVFNSPETSFAKPFLGTILKLENAIFGLGNAHFVEVKKNAFYKLISKSAQEKALKSSDDIANISTDWSASAMFAAYQSYLTIYINGITRRNYAYSYNTIASYDYWSAIQNNIGVKQRDIDIAQYLIPGVQNVGDVRNINNFNRESSVYIKTIDKRDGNSVTPLPFPSETPSLYSGGASLITDKSRYIISEKDNCGRPNREFDINVVSYYASIKNPIPNQWGQIYSYDTIDTGFQIIFNTYNSSVPATVFGGDTFINRFSFKTKLPFFIDNRVGAPDDSDVYYDEIGNVAYPKYWHSSRSILFDYVVETSGTVMKNIISIKAHNFDCANTFDDTFYSGNFYLFAYGIPTFYCESSVNVDLRQAFNNREGDFWPHVSTSIPDEWLQESYVPIVQDNTYYYNVTYSKQNKENSFSHLPVDWNDNQCYTNFPFRAIYSDRQQSFTDNRINSWLIYRPISFFDFPQNYGDLVSLDGIQNRAILARFENKSLLYNTMLTVETSNPQAAYLGNDTLFRSAPPIDFAETDLGYVGSQNKMLLKIPQGQITVDAKRGQIFLIAGNAAQDLSGFGSGMNRFFTDHLAFEILRYFPDVNTDNAFNGVGLHGVYDSKYDRVIITKLDYIPLNNSVKYDSVTQDFYIEQPYGQQILKVVVDLTDRRYFCNKSWTLSFNFNTKTWTSFHSYIPNFYIGENNFFYSGINEGCDLEAIAYRKALPASQCLEGLTIETIYIHSSSDLSKLPYNYVHPCITQIAQHICNRALFEIYGNNILIGESKLSNEGGTAGCGGYTPTGVPICQDFGNTLSPIAGPGTNIYSRYSAITLTGEQAINVAEAAGGELIEFSLRGALSAYGPPCSTSPCGDTRTVSHSNITWTRITTSEGRVLYNGCPEGNFVTVDVCRNVDCTFEGEAEQYYGVLSPWNGSGPIKGNVYALPPGSPTMYTRAQLANVQPATNVSLSEFNLSQQAWTGGFPGAPTLNTYYQINFTANLRIVNTGVHTFKVCASSGVRFRITAPNGNVIASIPTTSTSFSCAQTSLSLAAGVVVIIEIDYYKPAGSNIGLQLYWTQPSQPEQIIPAVLFL